VRKTLPAAERSRPGTNLMVARPVRAFYSIGTRRLPA
jgi:hypothetical protein